MPYYDGLNIILDKIKGIDYSTTLHSDQGVVYSSMAFTNAHKDYNIIRSMSRAGTSTDNPMKNLLTLIYIIIIMKD